MFFGASLFIFENAKALRKNMTDAEHIVGLFKSQTKWI